MSPLGEAALGPGDDEWPPTKSREKPVRREQKGRGPPTALTATGSYSDRTWPCVSTAPRVSRLQKACATGGLVCPETPPSAPFALGCARRKV